MDRKQQLDEALVNMVVEGSQPFSIVEDGGFKAFVALLDPTYTMPSICEEHGFPEVRGGEDQGQGCHAEGAGCESDFRHVDLH